MASKLTAEGQKAVNHFYRIIINYMRLCNLEIKNT